MEDFITTGRLPAQHTVSSMLHQRLLTYLLLPHPQGHPHSHLHLSDAYAYFCAGNTSLMQHDLYFHFLRSTHPYACG